MTDDDSPSADQCNIKPGFALIKPEFIVGVKSDEKANKEEESVEKKPSDEESVEKRSSEEERVEKRPSEEESVEKRPSEDSYHQPSHKKRRGQNKHRPKLIKEPRSAKLCSSLWCITEEEYNKHYSENESNSNASCPVSHAIENKHPICKRGKCSYSHNVREFVKNKQKDLEGECHNFLTYGCCDWGIVCRFAGQHSSNGFNVINEKLWSIHKDKTYVTNAINTEIRNNLRSKKYEFKLSDVVFKEACRAQSSANSVHKAIGPAPEGDKEPAPEGNKEPAAEGDKAIGPAPEGDKGPAAEEDEAFGPAPEGDNGPTPNGYKAIGPAPEGDEAIGPAPEGDNGPTPNGDKAIGPAPDEDLIKLRLEEKKTIDWSDKLYLAPLTTLGNLPFRRICRRFGADITCGEMAVSQCLLQGNLSEAALIKRHHSEEVFGVQLCGSNPAVMIRACELLNDHANVDFVDINMGCPIDLVYKQGAGSRLMERKSALELMVRGMSSVLPCPLTVKMRTSISQKQKTAHKIIPLVREWGAQMITLHGRSREQRYTKNADWDYIKECVEVAKPVPLYGNGDVLSYEDYQHNKLMSGVDGIMIGRGALMKPWIFTEIKENRHWDISATERFDILKEYVNFGLEYWGSDAEGVEKTRRFLLEWLSFLHRYIPLGLLERPPQTMNQKPPQYIGRSDLETLMISKSSSDWVKISEMLVGKVPENFVFLPKHKANAWN